MQLLVHNWNAPCCQCTETCSPDSSIHNYRRTFIIQPWASCQMRKIAGGACTGNAGNVFPRHRLERKSLVSDPGMRHGRCVTHVPCCISGSLTRDDAENVPGIPGACTTRDFTKRGPWTKKWSPQVTSGSFILFNYFIIRALLSMYFLRCYQPSSSRNGSVRLSARPSLTALSLCSHSLQDIFCRVCE